MIVYREQRRRIRIEEALARVDAAHGFERQMELGELESGVADALSPDFDSELPALRLLRQASLDAATAPGSANRLALDAARLPPEVEVSVPEGFAYYALDPELYRIAACRFARECRPGRVGVIGIRSIGTTLSTLVEAALLAEGIATRSWTVRPRGHPWDRMLRVHGDLQQTWKAWDGWFAVVDEGPGLSGTSFACVAGLLSELGVPDSRIVLFPSWCPDGSTFVSDAARQRWRRHRKYAAAFEDLSLYEGARDLSGGAWRELCGIWPAVQPQHERRKYLREGRLDKFAGYGRYGRAKVERAGALRDLVPPACGIERGFLSSRWMNHRPAGLSGSLIETAARYLALVRETFQTGAAPDFESLAGMIAVNAGYSPDPSQWRGAVTDGAAVVLDARMLPHEWIDTALGLRKTDALDHGDDHFFPGPQDTAWDLAAFSVEFSLDAAGDQLLLGRYQSYSGDRGAALRLPFYKLAYTAFRFGYSELALQALGEQDETERWRQARANYRALLKRQIGAIDG